MTRAGRLQSGRQWLENFSGKRVVPSYARWFAVDLLCAAKELQLLGVRLSPDYLEALRRTASAPATHHGSTRPEAESAGMEPMSNPEFAYIAGFTEGGAPFGVRWEEIDDLTFGEEQFIRAERRDAE